MSREAVAAVRQEVTELFAKIKSDGMFNTNTPEARHRIVEALKEGLQKITGLNSMLKAKSCRDLYARMNNLDPHQIPPEKFVGFKPVFIPEDVEESIARGEMRFKIDFVKDEEDISNL